MDPIYGNNDYILRKPIHNNQKKSLFIRIWIVVRDILISSAFFWGVSQPLFVAGLVSGAIFCRHHQELSTNVGIWWETSGWAKRIFAFAFGILSFPFLAKFWAFLWAAHISSGELHSAIEYKMSKDAGNLRA